jgi:hypothetical protein
MPGVTREDHYLDFKAAPHSLKTKGGADDLRVDVAAFANASGGTLVIGAQEADHVFDSFASVAKPHEEIRWIDEVLKECLEPPPIVEPHAVVEPGGASIVIVNVPPALGLIAHRVKQSYRFPLRAAESIRYMTAAEVLARMQGRERMHRLALEQIPAGTPVGIDAMVRTGDLSHNDWLVVEVQDDVVMLENDGLKTAVPLAYVEAVYRANEPGAEWIIALSCFLTRHRQRPLIQVTKGQPRGTKAADYEPRGLVGRG